VRSWCLLQKLRQEIKDQRALLEKPFADARREVKEPLSYLSV
jgi:hypothetical protein